MDQKTLTKLALSSYTNDAIDEKKVLRVAIQLDRKDLKKYIRAIKAIERKKNLFIQVPDKNKYKKLVEDIFSGKRLIIDEDPNLLMGIRITDDDMVYDMSLENRINAIIDKLEESYD